MIDFMGKKKIYFTISIVIIAISLIYSFIFGVKLDIQFKGGAMINYSYSGDINTDDVEGVVEKATGEDVSVQKTQGNINKLIVSLPKSLSIDSQKKMTDEIAKAFPSNNIVLLDSSNVNASMGKEFFAKCMVAIALASLLIIIYVGFRFRKIGGISAGAMGVIALFHDAFMVFAAFTFFQFPINDNFIAVVLTILGFSINDTIVIYDRIRENEKIYGNKKELAEIVNLSINQSLTRSINTSGCGLLVMIVTCIVAYINGVTSILTFALPMIIGMISGVYSTICIAGPLWVVWKNYRAKKLSQKTGGSKPSSSIGKIKI
ncbi:protein translocase subunit SecF [Acetanaerobacterium elongatum]|uniref:Protein-export membrane protein SecF n=1 Tax=Acetanaerobacterium elongatum TaxID=258515 RepID=A0A1H0AS31_9FIRM|nr:protein translocase subunit SecF [Acetanaerobacterium elongatum]SDN36191.1 preprotein translocase subunit SecF [Acetanaerobacterium elongatum]